MARFGSSVGKLPIDRMSDVAQSKVPMLTQPTTPIEKLITFEDLPLWPGDFAGDVLPTTYKGFSWTGWSQVYDADLLAQGTPVPSGYTQADASGPKAVISTAQSSIASPDGKEFDFESGYFTSSFSDGAVLEVLGFRDGVQVATYSASISTSASSFLSLGEDFNSVDLVTFESSGGTLNGFGSGNFFVADDLMFFI